MDKEKQRLDIMLVQGLCSNRNRARAEIMAVMFMSTAGGKINRNSVPRREVKLCGRSNPYEPGRLKVKSYRLFALDLQDKVVLDIGASTGDSRSVPWRQGKTGYRH